MAAGGGPALRRIGGGGGRMTGAAGDGVTRRAALLAALGAGAAALGLPASAQWRADARFPSLAAVLDVLLPGDALTPPASALGADREIAAFVSDSEPLVRLFAAALGWMDEQGGQPFGDLPADRQAALVQAMAVSDPNLVPGRFYHILRALAVEFHYARPEAIAGLALNPAPQPLGYPPPWG